MERPSRDPEVRDRPGRSRRGLRWRGRAARGVILAGVLGMNVALGQTPTPAPAFRPAPFSVPNATRVGVLRPVATSPGAPTTSLRLAQAPVVSPPQPIPSPFVPEAPAPAITPHVVVPSNAPPPEGAVLPAPIPGAANASTDLREIKNLQKELIVFVNQSKLFELDRGQKIVRMMIDNPKVADVQFLDANDAEPAPHQPDWLPVRPGGLDHLVRRADRPSFIRCASLSTRRTLEKRLREVLPGADVTVRQVAQQIILEGQVPDTKTMSQLLDLVQSELRLTGQANLGSLAGAVGVGGGGGAAGTPGGTTQAINSQGQSPLSVASTGNAQPGLIIVNRVRVPGPRQVVLRVKIAELNRTAMRQIGVSWLDSPE